MSKLFDLELFSQVEQGTPLKAFQKDDSSHHDKKITLNIECNSQTAIESLKISGDLIEHICIVGIGVWPKTRLAEVTTSNGTTSQGAIDQSGATYEIGFEVEGFHALLFSHTEVRLQLAPNEEQLFQFHLHQETEVSHDQLAFDIQMTYGYAEMLVSKSERNPCNASKSSAVSMVYAKDNQFASLVFGKAGISLPSLTGTYFICVKSVGVQTSLNIMPSPHIETNSLFAFDDDLMRLVPNQNLVGQIKDGRDKLEFIFHLNFDAREAESISIHLTPLKGASAYRIIASNHGYEPRTDQSFWNVVGNSLTITSNDKYYKSKADYRVKIVLANEADLGSTVHKFLVSYTIGSTHNVLKIGMPFIGEFSKDITEKLFRLEIPPMTKNLTILKTNLEGSVMMQGSFKNSPIGASSEVYIPDHYVGYFLDQTTLEKNCPQLTQTECHLYIAVKNTTAQNSTFLIAYSVDNLPFFLHSSFGFNLPPGLSFDHKMFFVYELPDNHKDPVTVEWEYNYQQAKCFLKYTKNSLDYAFPKEGDFNKIVSGHFSSIEISQSDYLENNVILMTVELKINHLLAENPHINLDKLGFISQGRLSVVTGARRLLPDIPVRGHANSSWQIFNLYHKSSQPIVLHFESTFGICSIKLNKGIHSKVFGEENLVSREILDEETIVVTPAMMPFGHKIEGPYTLALSCLTPANYRLEYKTGVNNIHQLLLNRPTSFTILQDAQVFFEFDNIVVNSSLDILVKSSASNVTLHVISIPPKLIDPNDSQSDNNHPSDANMPSEEFFDFKTELPIFGLGKLTIGKDDPKNCLLCRFIVLVQTSEEDTVQITAKRSSPDWPIDLRVDAEMIGLLEAGQSDYYFLREDSEGQDVSAFVFLTEGNLTIEHSMYPFSNETNLATKDHLAGHSKSYHFSHEAASKYVNAYMYMKITANSRSVYALDRAEMRDIQVIHPLRLYHGSKLVGGATRTYVLKTEHFGQVQATLKITSIGMKPALMMNQFNLENYLAQDMISVHVAESVDKVRKGDYDQIPSELYIRRLDNTFEVQLNARLPVVVFKVKNTRDVLIDFTFEVTSQTRMSTRAEEYSVNFFGGVYAYQFYHIPVSTERAWFNFQINQCTEHLNVEYQFVPISKTSTAPAVKGTLFSKYMDQRSVEIFNGPGTLMLEFKNDNYPAVNDILNKFNGRRQDTVYSMWYSINSENAAEHNIAKEYQMRPGGDQGKVQVVDINGDIMFDKVYIKDIETLLKTHNVKVTYTLILASNKGMLNHLMHCGDFDVAEAKKYHQADAYYIFPLVDFITEENYYFQKKFEKENRHFLSVEDQERLSISPNLMSFGDVYEAAVVAKVLVYGKDVK